MARILVVEDNYADVVLMRKAFREKQIPFEITHFEDGDLAIQALEESDLKPDLILLDMNLPRISGLEVLLAIKQIPRLQTTPVAIVTSSRSPQDRDRALSGGALRYIQKPSTLDEFLNEVGGSVRAMLEQSGTLDPGAISAKLP